MKKRVIAVIMLLLFLVGCGLFRETIKVKRAIEYKQQIDKTNNPAQSQLIKNDLSKKRIRLDNVLVKDVVGSTNIDYNFSVVVEASYNGKSIECYVYARDFYNREDVKTIAKLKPGKSRIDVVGDFGRFFTLLDDSYTKIEILNANISIKEEK